MTQITSAAQIKELGTILGIWAHPDDETFMSGGLMALAAQNGQIAACITATRGEAGVYDPLRWPAETIGATRAVELAEALRILGVNHHNWLHYKDGGCSLVSDDQATMQLLPLIEKYRPDTIVTFPPDGITGHDDHKTISRWTGLVAQKASKRPKVLYAVNSATSYASYLKEMDEKLNIYFNIDQPDLYEKSECDLVLALPKDAQDKKYRAFKAMPSQTAVMLKEYSLDYVCQAFSEECYVWAGKEHEAK